MKILIDARLYGLENAGLGRYVINLLGQLQEQDQENEYLVLLRKKYFNQLNLAKNFKKILADFRHYGFREQIELPRIVFQEKPDLCHFPHFNVPVLIGLTGKKYLVTIHDMLMHKQKGLEATTLNPIIYQIKRLFYKLVFQRAVKKAKKIIVPSRVVKEELIKKLKVKKSKITVIYEGVDQKILIKKSPKQQQKILEKYHLKKGEYFIYTGNAYPHKNLKRAIKAALALNEEIKTREIKLAIACSRNVFSQRLERQIRQLKAEKEIELLGFVPDQELGILYQNSIAFLYPSISEGFGLPGLEAIQSGTLVLASNIPIFKEIYQEGAIYFNPFNFMDMAKTMQNTMELTEEQRREKIKKGKEQTKQYSWQKMAKQTLQLYNSL